MRRYVPSDQSLPHSSSRCRCAPFWTHSPGLSLVPVPQILVSTFSVCLRGKLLLPPLLLQSKGSVRAALWGFRCSEPCLMAPPSENMRPLETLWMHIRCVWESIVPGTALAVGERNWRRNYSFSVGGIWGEITSLPSLKTSRQTEKSVCQRTMANSKVLLSWLPSLLHFSHFSWYFTLLQ